VIRLRFVAGDDLFSRIIRGAQLGFSLTHVEAVTPEGTLLGAHTDGGVQNRTPGYDEGRWTKQLFVDLPATTAQAHAFYSFLIGQVGKAYDMDALAEMAEGVLGIPLPDAPAHLATAWICSALQTAALLTAGIVRAAPATVRRATPRDVLCMCAALAPVSQSETP
jgi:hypothetical protein